MERTLANTGPVHQPPLILLIEDFVDLRRQLRACLVHHGFRVRELACGDDVLVTPREIVCAADFALVDDSLPGHLTGPQTVVLLHLINPRLRIFPITGRPFQDWELELMDTHYQQCLEKPFGIAELLAALTTATAPLP